jgi:DNA-directed RNA polymerase I and III subunit RPAC1
MNKTEMEFDFIGVDASIANSFRRILLSEVPSMAFEKVGMYNNTSILPDEVLAHRLGLIPLKADARQFSYRLPEREPVETDTLFFELNIKCSWNPKRPKDSSDPDEMYINHKVYSKDIKWTPIGAQADLHGHSGVGPLEPDILIAKLRPGHEISLKLEAVKGIGKDHAKFCPVATAFYRLLPEITLKRDIVDEQAERLQKCFSPGVIALDEKDGKRVARVQDARYDSCSRNVMRYEDLADAVQLSRIKDHFIFTVESSCGTKPDDLFIESIKVLRDKCRKFLAEIKKSDLKERNQE